MKLPLIMRAEIKKILEAQYGYEISEEQADDIGWRVLDTLGMALLDRAKRIHEERKKQSSKGSNPE